MRSTEKQFPHEPPEVRSRWAIERWIRERLDAAGGSMRAAEIVSAAVAEGLGSAATVQRAGATIARKSRIDGEYVWSVPVEDAPAAVPAQDASGYETWDDARLIAECARRNIRTGWEPSHVELVVYLQGHDDGRLTRALPAANRPY